MYKILGVLLALLLGTAAYAEEPEWSNYAGLLSDHVSLGEKHGIKLNLVDYQEWGKDRRWDKLLKIIEVFDISNLKSRDEKLAFWVNIYNILAIKVVLDHMPVESIRDIGSFFSSVWKKDAGIIAGKMRTLDEVEHEILRPMGDPRIHFAIVCASVSCPDLLPDVYRVEGLSAQLDSQVARFVKHKRKGIALQGQGILISRIFDWFEGDFEADGGVQTWLLNLPDPVAGKVLGYLDYDWSLNGKSNNKR